MGILLKVLASLIMAFVLFVYAFVFINAITDRTARKGAAFLYGMTLLTWFIYLYLWG